MKKMWIVCTILTGALLFAGCNKVETETQPEVEKAILSATISDNNTKTYIYKDGEEEGTSVLWSEGDALAVISNTDWNPTQYTLENGKNTKQGEFHGLRKEGDRFLAVYPYAFATHTAPGGVERLSIALPATQPYSANLSGSLPMYASGSSLIGMSFHNMCSVIRLKLYAKPGDNARVKSIKLTSNSANRPNRLRMFWQDGSSWIGPSITGGADASYYVLQLDCGVSGVALSEDSETPTEFNLVSYGNVTAEGGFDVIVTTTENKTMSFSKTNSFSFVSGRIHKFPKLLYTEDTVDPTKLIRIDSDDEGDWIILGEYASLPEPPIPGSKVEVKTTGANPITAADFDQILGIVNSTAATSIRLDLSGSSYASTTMPMMQSQEKINHISLFNNIVSLPSSCLKSCSRLSTVSMPGVQHLGIDVFFGTRITNLELPKSVTDIDGVVVDAPLFRAWTVEAGNPKYWADTEGAHAGVLYEVNNSEDKIKLKLIEYPRDRAGSSYSIPSTVTHVINSSIRYNYYLTAITIPASVTSFGGYNLNYTIKDIYCLAPTPTFTIPSTCYIKEVAVEDFGECKLHVPSGSSSNYTWSWIGTKRWKIYEDATTE